MSIIVAPERGITSQCGTLSYNSTAVYQQID